MARLRTIHQAYNLIKFEDPDTAVSENLIRKLVNEGKIPSIKSGTWFLIDVDAALDYLYKNTSKKC